MFIKNKEIKFIHIDKIEAFLMTIVGVAIGFIFCLIISNSIIEKELKPLREENAKLTKSVTHRDSIIEYLQIKEGECNGKHE